MLRPVYLRACPATNAAARLSTRTLSGIALAVVGVVLLAAALLSWFTTATATRGAASRRKPPALGWPGAIHLEQEARR
jgi:uncharacterized membrane protein YidH (DUF202 family)